MINHIINKVVGKVITFSEANDDIVNHGKGKVCPNRNWVSQEDSSVLALNSGFCSIRRLGVFLLPLDGIPVHCRLPLSILSVCPQANCWFPFIHLSGERHCESKVFCLRTHRGCTGQGSNS